MISIQELRGAIKLPEGADAEQLRSTVIGIWERATGRRWNRTVDYEQTFTGYFVPVLLLELTPVESITKVETRERGNTWTTLDSNSYMLFGPRRLERTSGCWGYMTRVTYTGGYTESPTGQQAGTPAEVRKALIVQAQFMVNRLNSERVHLESTSTAGGSSTYLEEATLQPLVKELADRLARKY